MAQQYKLCDGCNAGVANDDWTHLDLDAQLDADLEYNRALATLDALPTLSHSHTSEDSGYFDCAVCADIQCGNPNIWEAIA